MRLSDAIKLGAMMKPQGFGAWTIDSAKASCALGAAADAVGIFRGNSRYSELNARWPILYSLRVPHPVTQKVTELADVIWLLNDIDRWTREQIAEWVATIEPPEPAMEETTSGADDSPAVVAEDWKTGELPVLALREKGL